MNYLALPSMNILMAQNDLIISPSAQPPNLKNFTSFHSNSDIKAIYIINYATKAFTIFLSTFASLSWCRLLFEKYVFIYLSEIQRTRCCVRRQRHLAMYNRWRKNPERELSHQMLVRNLENFSRSEKTKLFVHDRISI